MNPVHTSRITLRSACALLLAALAVLIFPFALTLGWPVNTEQHLILFVSSNGGAVEISNQEVVSFSYIDRPFPESHLQHLRLFPQLESLELDVSRCSPESVAVLGELQELESISLIGSDPQTWHVLMELPKISRLSLSHGRLEAYPGGSQEDKNVMAISQKRLTVREAQAINAIRDLKVFSLNVRTTQNGVWETLAENRSLKSLSIRINVANTNTLASRREFKQLAAIPTLEEILLVDFVQRKSRTHPYQRHRIEFQKLRSDVKVQLVKR